MVRRNTDIDSLLKSAMCSTETPDPELTHKVYKKIFTEENIMKKSNARKPMGTIIAACLSVTFLATTAFAAWNFLKPSEIADKFGDTALSSAFESDSAVNINKTVTSGDYTFTLLATVSGSDLTDTPACSNGQVLEGRTYAVLAIQKTDGSPMPATSDDEYSNVSFYASPYVKGLKPWEINAHTLNGGHSDTVIDGVMYRIIQCDEVSIFADRDVYLGVITGSFYNNQALPYDETTGEIKANPDYEGSSVVFDLPLDKSLADPDKAQEYLSNMWDE